MEAEREDFEAIFSASLRMDRWGDRTSLAGEYRSHHTQCAWEGYQAGRAAQAAAVKVPAFSLTDEQMDSVITDIAALNTGDLGFNGFVDRIVALAAAADLAAATKETP